MTSIRPSPFTCESNWIISASYREDLLIAALATRVREQLDGNIRTHGEQILLNQEAMRHIPDSLPGRRQLDKVTDLGYVYRAELTLAAWDVVALKDLAPVKRREWNNERLSQTAEVRNRHKR